jgi:cytochrome c biogenesis protein CcmG, thiol:disulfide interchange protein DsbE
MNRGRIQRGLLVGLFVVAAIAGVIALEIATSGSEERTRPAPELPSQVLQGPRVTLAALHGTPALINFWASWCDPCREEAPELERFSRSLHGRAELVGVDWNDRTDNALAFIHEFGLTYPILRDGSQEVGTDYGLNGLPTTFILDAQGRIVQTLQGPQTTATLQAALEEASSGD